MGIDRVDIGMKIIALGMGTQSTCLYFMSSMGEFERADYAIFSDPCAEHPDTYKLAEYLKDWEQKNNGVPIQIVSKNLYQDILDSVNSTGQRFASIPAYTEGGGMVRRQCTNEYKIQPLTKKVRELYGLKKHKRMPKTEIWLGITTDEAQRMKLSQLPRLTNRYPFMELMMNRNDCIEYFKKHNLPIPIKSSCIFCPYKSDKNWLDMKRNNTDLFQKALKCDYAIRDSSMRGIKEKLYLHKSLVPLDKVILSNENQIDMFGNECEGYCGI